MLYKCYFYLIRIIGLFQSTTWEINCLMLIKHSIVLTNVLILLTIHLSLDILITFDFYSYK